MADKPPHPSVSTIREIANRAVNAGQVPASYVADNLRKIAQEIDPQPPSEAPPQSAAAAAPQLPPWHDEAVKAGYHPPFRPPPPGAGM